MFAPLIWLPQMTSRDPGDNVTMEAQIEESVQRIPISVLGSLGSTRDASHEELWLRSEEQA
jgi:hypothetical protein